MVSGGMVSGGMVRSSMVRCKYRVWLGVVW